VRLLRAKVIAGDMTEAEATAMLGTSPFAAQGTIPALWPRPRSEGFDAGGHCDASDSLHAAEKLTGSGKLSAAWVTRLMGFPDGWLDVD